MFLNDSIIRNARPGPKPRKLKDGDGLFLLVQPTGARWWRMRYTVHGVEKALSLGVYPEITFQAGAPASRGNSVEDRQWCRPERGAQSGETRTRHHIRGRSAGMVGKAEGSLDRELRCRDHDALRERRLSVHRS